MPDLIRLDSTNSDEDIDPLLSKSFVNTNQMSQSLHIPTSSEGLSNPLYPYFLPRHSNTDSNDGVEKNSKDELGDLDLLQEYGLDFHKFNLTNGTSSTRISETTNNFDNVFGLSFPTSTAKSQNHWTKFE